MGDLHRMLVQFKMGLKIIGDLNLADGGANGRKVNVLRVQLLLDLFCLVYGVLNQSLAVDAAHFHVVHAQFLQNLDLLVMLFTDVMGEGSMFIYDGPMSYVLSDILETTFDDNSGFDSGIISRKQQLMPRLSEIMKNI